MNEPETLDSELMYLSDIFMRILANRKLIVCQGVLQGCLVAIAETLPKDGRDFLTESMADTIAFIDAIEDPSPESSH